MPEALPRDPQTSIMSLIDSGTPVVALHGFTQTGRSWAPIAAASGAVLVTPDLPGHGQATATRPSDLDGAADFVAGEVRAQLGGRAAVWVGYSLGGRVLLHLALRHPDLVSGLVLVSTTGGIYDQTERDERRAADERLATRIEAIGVEQFLDEWLSQPLFRSLTVSEDDRATRAANTAEGLASSLRTCGTGTQRPLWVELASITVPTMVIAGEIDTKFCAFAERLASTITNSSAHILSGLGHACHLEDPQRFTELVFQERR